MQAVIYFEVELFACLDGHIKIWLIAVIKKMY
jgi:hypothetical protein